MTGDDLKTLRERHNLSQAAAAQLLKLGTSALRNYEQSITAVPAWLPDYSIWVFAKHRGEQLDKPKSWRYGLCAPGKIEYSPYEYGRETAEEDGRNTLTAWGSPIFCAFTDEVSRTYYFVCLEPWTAKPPAWAIPAPNITTL